MHTRLKHFLACGAAAALFAPALAQEHRRHGSEASMHMHSAMCDAQQRSAHMKMSGDPDADFAMLMRSHHEAGIAMAQLEVAKGQDPAMKQMAQTIIDTQRKEIKQFDDWLARRKH